MKSVPLLVSMILTAASGLSQNGPPSGFSAGAGKVDVTPAASELPKTSEGILDHLYSRAIVIGNGAAKAALLTLDAGAMPDQLWQNVTKRAETELGIPAKHILMTATHAHSVPRGATSGLEEKVFESLKIANRQLQPARIGILARASLI